MVFADWPGIEVDSAGTNSDADQHLTAELIEWSDVIVAMEKIHRRKIRQRFRRWLKDQRVVCLDIPDNYAFMEAALVELLKAKMAAFLPKSAAA